jgi:hypothetical protein
MTLSDQRSLISNRARNVLRDTMLLGAEDEGTNAPLPSGQ